MIMIKIRCIISLGFVLIGVILATDQIVLQQQDSFDLSKPYYESEPNIPFPEENHLIKYRDVMISAVDEIFESIFPDLDFNSKISTPSPSISPSTISTLSITPSSTPEPTSNQTKTTQHLNHVLNKIRTIMSSSSNNDNNSTTSQTNHHPNPKTKTEKESIIKSFTKTLSSTEVSQLRNMSAELKKFDEKQIAQNSTQIFPKLISLIGGKNILIGNETKYNNNNKTNFQSLIELGEEKGESEKEKEKEKQNENSSNSLLPEKVPEPQKVIDKMTKNIFSEIIKLAQNVFPDPSEEQIKSALNLLTSSTSQQKTESTKKFLETLTESQSHKLSQTQSNIQNQIIDVVKSPNEIISFLEESEDTIKKTVVTFDQNRIFENLLPLLNQISIFSVVIIPSVYLHKINKKNIDLNKNVFVDSLLQICFHSSVDSNMNDNFTFPVEAFHMIGKSLSEFSDYNPAEIAINLLEKQEMNNLLEKLINISSTIPEFSEQQLRIAEKSLLIIGSRMNDQQTALNDFLLTLNENQTEIITKIQYLFMSSVIKSFVNENREVSKKLVIELKRQLNMIEGRKKLIEEREKVLIKKSSENSKSENLESSKLVKTFSRILPLVDQFCVCVCSAIPQIYSHEKNIQANQFNETDLVKSYLNASETELQELSNPFSLDDAIYSFVLLGEKQEIFSNFNPISFIFSLLNDTEVHSLFNNISICSRSFPPLSDSQLELAKKSVNSLSKSFEDSRNTIKLFTSTFSEQQKKVILPLRQTTAITVSSKIVDENGDPSHHFISLIQSEIIRIKSTNGI